MGLNVDNSRYSTWLILGIFVVSVALLFGIPLMTWIYFDTLKTKVQAEATRVQAEEAVKKVEKFLKEQEKDEK